MRFSLIYNIGEELSSDELMEKYDQEEYTVKIRDLTNELEDLIITNKDVGRDYVDYLNNSNVEKEILTVMERIVKNLYELNEMNRRLISPRGDLDEVLSDETDLREKLYYEGYSQRVKNYTDKIVDDLTQIKRLLNYI